MYEIGEFFRSRSNSVRSFGGRKASSASNVSCSAKSEDGGGGGGGGGQGHGRHSSISSTRTSSPVQADTGGMALAAAAVAAAATTALCVSVGGEGRRAEHAKARRQTTGCAPASSSFKDELLGSAGKAGPLGMFLVVPAVSIRGSTVTPCCVSMPNIAYRVTGVS